MAKVTFDIIQDGETIVMVGKAKPIQKAAAAKVETVQSDLLPDLRDEGEHNEVTE